MAAKSTDRRAFLADVFKFSAGAAALSVVAGCDALDLDEDRHGRRGCRNKANGDLEQTTRVAAPTELFEPMTRGFVMNEKWRLEDVLVRPDKHLRVRLTDVTTDNPLDIELFRGPDAKKRAIAATDYWEFYTYNADEAGKSTPDHVTDAVNQLAAVVLGTEQNPAIRNLNAQVCLFADRLPDAPTPDQEGPVEKRAPATVAVSVPKTGR